MDRIVDRAEGRALGHLAERRSGRVLPFRQPVDAVVEQDDFQIDIAAQRMHEMIAADRQGVAVAGDHPDHEIGPADFQAGGHGGRPAVNRMDSVSVHVIGKPAGAADAGHEHHFLRRHAERRQHLFHLGQNRIVAAAGTPANVLIAGEILRSQHRQLRIDAHGMEILWGSGMVCNEIGPKPRSVSERHLSSSNEHGFDWHSEHWSRDASIEVRALRSSPPLQPR